jgi:NAD(P)-dependent dehydrogenase (short-subunit alcohol dehydrogenase family)
MAEYDPIGEAAVVTGGAGGIGEAIALELAGGGLDVAVFDVDGEGAADTAAAIREEGVAASVHGVDVADEAAVERGVEAAVERHGRIDVLVNAAGIQLRGPIAEYDADDWDRQFAVNARGTFLPSKHVARHLIERGDGGRIVNVASQVGKRPSTGIAAYSASKAAVISFTRTLALELADHDVGVNAVCPGKIGTGLLEEYAADQSDDARTVYDRFAEEIPRGRLGTPADVASLVAFLASEAADFVTGQAITVSGGETLV